MFPARPRLPAPLPAALAAALSLAPTLPACAGGDGPADAGSHDASSPDGPHGGTLLQVGGSDEKGKEFVDLSSGDVERPILRGPQGGQHMWVMVRFKGDGLWSKKLRIAVTMTLRATGVVVKPGTVTVTQTLADKDGWMALGTAIPAFVKCPCQVYGRTLDIRAAVVDLYGREMGAEAAVIGTWDGACAGDPPGSCKSQ